MPRNEVQVEGEDANSPISDLELMYILEETSKKFASFYGFQEADPIQLPPMP